jgi:hypothetical protein
MEGRGHDDDSWGALFEEPPSFVDAASNGTRVEAAAGSLEVAVVLAKAFGSFELGVSDCHFDGFRAGGSEAHHVGGACVLGDSGDEALCELSRG